MKESGYTDRQKLLPAEMKVVLILECLTACRVFNITFE
jgi:hypothetical protein